MGLDGAHSSRTRPVPTRQRVLVVEDEARIREIVHLYLDRGGFDVIEAADGRAGLAAFDADPPDLVVVDLLLPGLTGEALVRAIRDVSDVPIIVASAKRGDEDRIGALREGADDYVTKPFNPVELVERVRAVLRRTHPASVHPDRRLSFGAGRLTVEPGLRRFVCDGRAGRLTPTEARILVALASGAGSVLDREQLLQAATRGTSETTRTIDVHVANLRRKLSDDPAAPWAIETIPDAGYRWIAPADPADARETAEPNARPRRAAR